jgi:hypothetical protein
MNTRLSSCAQDTRRLGTRPPTERCPQTRPSASARGAIHTESRRMILVEAKRLWAQKNAEAINDDIDKLAIATLPTPVDDDIMIERWIIVLTHEDELPGWWTDPVPAKRPMELKDKHVAAWEALEANISAHPEKRVVLGPYQGPQLKRPVSVVAAQIAEAVQPPKSR